MSPRLIVFCDGTWNSRGDTRSDATPTNVWRLYSAIESADVADQKGLYLHGVGSGWSSSIGKLWAALNKLTGGSLDPIFGGASGWGLSRQVREGYSFLVREYQPGDEIYIFGFSRGAFAARSLVGLLKHAGLLRRDSAHEIRRVTKSYHRLLRGRRHKALLASLRERTHYPVRVRFLGVWDTVGALGAPIWGGSFSLNPLPVAPRYHDVNALDIVDQTFHAVAIDEKRATYAPVLFEGHSWNESSRLEQVWFRGRPFGCGWRLYPIRSC